MRAGKSACRIVPPGEGQEVKKDWTPTQTAFRQFLDWLDEGVASGGEKYLEMRRRLVFYFDRKNCLASDELADETLSRVAQKLEEKGSITGMSPPHYCYVVAKFVFLENLRQAKRGHSGLNELAQARLSSGGSLNSKDTATMQSRERLHECLDSCLAKLSSADRELILEYYRGEQRAKIERRSQLAARLGLSMNALTIRACRIRYKLEECMRACCDET
jgi:DNA-directed RNA polymerase specialized sigma24 family protein